MGIHRVHCTKISSNRCSCSLSGGEKGAYGTIQGCMDTLPKVKAETPPPLVRTFVRGFNVVAGHAWLIVPPILLDLFLWFGPHLSLQKLLSPIFSQVTAEMVRTAGSTLPENFNEASQMMQTMLAGSNLMTALRSYPIGIPSLMAMVGPMVNPLGAPITYDIPDVGTALLIWLGLTFLGVVFGSAYFTSLARAAGTAVEGIQKVKGLRILGQVLIFTLLFYAVVIVVGFPFMMILGVITMISPAIGQVIFMVGTFLVLWFLMPLVFSPFGIFTAGQKVVPSLATAFKLVRGYLRGTGLFVLTAILVEVILDLLWTNIPAGSWLMLLSIGGHAFVSTALITSVFVYYLAGLRWMRIRTSGPETISVA